MGDDCETMAQSIATDPGLALGCTRTRASPRISSIGGDLVSEVVIVELYSTARGMGSAQASMS